MIIHHWKAFPGIRELNVTQFDLIEILQAVFDGSTRLAVVWSWVRGGKREEAKEVGRARGEAGRMQCQRKTVGSCHEFKVGGMGVCDGFLLTSHSSQQLCSPEFSFFNKKRAFLHIARTSEASRDPIPGLRWWDEHWKQQICIFNYCILMKVLSSCSMHSF